MKTPTAPTTDGLEWLHTIRRDLQREIGQTPQERAAYYQAREKKLRGRKLRGRKLRGRKLRTTRRVRQAAA